MGIYARIFAAVYERGVVGREGRRFRELRRRALAGATGRTLELGAGPGNNAAHYPAAVERLVLSEPDSPMLARLRANLAGSDTAAEAVQASADALPFADDSFDTVTALLVLCTVPDPAAALVEVARVLRPGGRLLFFEHVRAPEPRLARWQDRWERPWQAIGRGCRCNRPTPDLIAASPLEIETLERGELPGVPGIVRPYALGSAVAA